MLFVNKWNIGRQERKYRFYFASLSSRTIVYKGLLTPEQVDAFYLRFTR